MAKIFADYFGGLIKGLGGGYLLSPAGGIGRKSLLTLGKAGGVYFFEGSDAKGFFSAFFGAGSPFTNRTTCRTQKRMPTIQIPMTADSYKVKSKPVRKIVTTKKRIPNAG
ncbi:MAG TPA: hypothetical protein VJW94_18785 [Candidatus Acidoferrum sp.]|nr:hypothetical protein [Candidatus Acidoferrum sp.]